MRTVIIDEPAAHMYFPGEDPIGRQVALGQSAASLSDPWTVIGMVGFVRYSALDEIEGLSFIYFPDRNHRTVGNRYFVRTTRPPAEVLGLIRTRMREVDPTLEQYHFRDMSAFVLGPVDGRRGPALSYGMSEPLSLFLAAFGTYSVLSYEVSQRTREIGIRSAIGATRRGTIRHILGHDTRKGALGLAVGTAGSLVVGWVLSASLFGVSSHDPVSFFGAAPVLLGSPSSQLRCPPWRATRIDRMQTLRAELALGGQIGTAARPASRSGRPSTVAFAQQLHHVQVDFGLAGDRFARGR